jgi:hypothetical protein
MELPLLDGNIAFGDVDLNAPSGPLPLLRELIARDHGGDGERTDDEVENAAIHCPSFLLRYVSPLMPGPCVASCSVIELDGQPICKPSEEQHRKSRALVLIASTTSQLTTDHIGDWCNGEGRSWGQPSTGKGHRGPLGIHWSVFAGGATQKGGSPELERCSASPARTSKDQGNHATSVSATTERVGRRDTELMSRED